MSTRFEFAIGREKMVVETGKLAKQADGAVTVQYGGTVVLVTAVMRREASPDIDFLPLTVEYQEKTYAAGRIPGGFFKREGRPSEKEILTARLIDRPIRPLFPSGLYNEIQIVAIVLSSDGENDPDILAVNGASMAIMLSGIPFNGPIGAVRVGRIDGTFVVNPTYDELQKSVLDLVVVSSRKGIIMTEAGCKQVPEETMVEALQFGYTKTLEIIRSQEEFVSKLSPSPIPCTLRTLPEELVRKVREISMEKIKEACKLSTKEQREEMMSVLSKEAVEQLSAGEGSWEESDVRAALVKAEKYEVRRQVLEDNVRIDGRGYKDLRNITCEIGVLPRTHGSGLFTRGQTQSLAVTTLGTSADEQLIEALDGESFKSFMLHYSFPPFSVGEVKPMRGPGRREIGHGALAERALHEVMPTKENFPYTVRVVSEILESNGSTSMATVCAGSLSLMDAGVPLSTAVGGISIGLIKEGEKIALLTDILGMEDHFGDMDFKVTGTRSGVTALQLDLKIEGISVELLSQALYQAKDARMVILDKMKEALSEPRSSISTYAPRIVTLKINPDKIKDVIGPGGKIIKKITAETGVTIDIEDDGKVMVASVDSEAAQKAIEIIKGLTAEVEVGKIYSGKVKRLMNFGAFVEVLPGKEGLVHVSELSDKYVSKVEDVVKIGDEFMVKVIEIDNQGRVNLSRKQALRSENKDKTLPLKE